MKREAIESLRRKLSDNAWLLREQADMIGKYCRPLDDRVGPAVICILSTAAQLEDESEKLALLLSEHGQA